MLRLKCLMTALMFAGLVSSALAAGDPVGTWDVTMDIGGREMTAQVIIEKKGDGYAGKWVGRRGESELSDVKFENGKLSFVRKMEREGQSFEMPFEGTVEGDELKGNVSSQLGEAPLTGKRAGAAGAAGSGPSIVGTWNVTSVSQLGTLKRKLVVKPDMKGTYETESNKFEVKNLKQTGSDVTFDVTLSLEGQELPMAFAGKVEGDKLAGKFQADGQDMAELTGERDKATPAGGAVAGAAVGTWDITSESQLGTLKRKLTINPDGTGTYDTGEVKYPVKDLKVDGNNLTFDVTVSVQGTDLPLKFNGTVDGSNISGKLVSEMGEGIVKGTKAQ